jgi:hypothetical protein
LRLSIRVQPYREGEKAKVLCDHAASLYPFTKEAWSTRHAPVERRAAAQKKWVFKERVRHKGLGVSACLPYPRLAIFILLQTALTAMASAAVAAPLYSESEASYWPHDLRESLGLQNVNKPLFSPPQPPAHIKFHPDLSVYEARRTARVREGGLEKAVPSRWPATLNGPLAWKGSDFRDEAEFVYHLSEADKAEIKSALKQVKGEPVSWFWRLLQTIKVQGLAFDDIKEDTFALPGLRSRLKEAQDKIYNGIGFAVLRGLDVDEYSSEECLRILLGVSSYLAARRGAQDQDGNLLRKSVSYQTPKNVLFAELQICRSSGRLRSC